MIFQFFTQKESLFFSSKKIVIYLLIANFFFLFPYLFIGKRIQFSCKIEKKNRKNVHSYVRNVSSQNLMCIYCICEFSEEKKLNAILNRVYLIWSVYWDILLLIVYRITYSVYCIFEIKKNHICQSSLRSYCSIHFFIFHFCGGKKPNELVCAREIEVNWTDFYQRTLQMCSIHTNRLLSPVAFIEFWLVSTRVSEWAYEWFIK